MFDFDELDQLEEQCSSENPDVEAAQHEPNELSMCERATVVSCVADASLQRRKHTDTTVRQCTAEVTSSETVSACTADASAQDCITSNAPVPQERPSCGVHLCFDSKEVLRGSCSACDGCTSWTKSYRNIIAWPHSPFASQPIANEIIDRCECCGCHSYDHKNLTPWLEEVKATMRRLRKTGIDTKRVLPSNSVLPSRASRWTPHDAAFQVLTLGLYDPDKHNPPARTPNAQPGVLLSVCVPTSASRHCFHPLLYENFITQTYEPKELVVVDVGFKPSTFLELKSRSDPRIIYRHFQANDAHEERREALRSMQWLSGSGRCRARAPPVTMRLENWSLGLKRNLCCHLARGAIILHFDDDDLYAPDYLDHMSKRLLDSVARKRPEALDEAQRGEHPAIATLRHWHTMDMPDKVFRWMDPMTDPMPKEWRDPMLYGYGFSYIYTRAAWLLHAFPDVEASEDDVFMRNLRKSRALVTLLDKPSEVGGLVAHVCHSENTGILEWNGPTRLGTLVETPKAFEGLMPIVNKLASSRKAGKPPPTFVKVINVNASKPGRSAWDRHHNLFAPRAADPNKHPWNRLRY